MYDCLMFKSQLDNGNKHLWPRTRNNLIICHAVCIQTVYKIFITAIPLKCDRFSKLAVIVANIWVGTEFVQAHPKTSQQHKPNRSSRSVLSCKQFELRSAVESWDLVLFQLLGHCVCVCLTSVLEPLLWLWGFLPICSIKTNSNEWCLLSDTESDHHNYMCNILKTATTPKMLLECQNTQLKNPNNIKAVVEE